MIGKKRYIKVPVSFASDYFSCDFMTEFFAYFITIIYYY